jgi:predicted transcriptional regulator
MWGYHGRDPILPTPICWHTMKRTTVKISDELDARLRREAGRRGMTISELTREALEAHVGDGRAALRRAAGSGRSGAGDISERIEEILASEAGRFRS